MRISSSPSGWKGFTGAIRKNGMPLRAYCISILALAVLLSCRPALGQTLALQAGGMEMRDSGHDGSYAWGLEFMEELAPHFALSLLYLNEGHPNQHHRDGFGAQAWLRAPLGERLTLAAGAGPYYYFDTARRGQSDYANHHGFGLVYSLAAAIAIDERWSLQLRLNRVDARSQFDTDEALLGVGYRLDDAPARASAAVSYAADRTSEITLLAGRTIVNSFESELGPAASIEYRKTYSRHVEWTVGFLKEGDRLRVHRNGITAQGWLTYSTADNRINFGIGLGPYLALDRSNTGGAEEGERLAGMVSLNARYRLAPRWHAQATWNRVFTEDDRNTDVLLIGAGYRF